MCHYEVQTLNVRLRDTGAAMSMIHLGCVPDIETALTGKNVVAAALDSRVPCPRAKDYIESPA